MEWGPYFIRVETFKQYNIMNEKMNASKKEITNVCEVLDEENKRLIRKVNALECELSKYTSEKSKFKKAYEHMLWWYDYNCADAVNSILFTAFLTISGLFVGYYVIASLGMEFLPEITEPVTDFIKRAVGSLLPWK